jgi:hypothetical protein
MNNLIGETYQTRNGKVVKITSEDPISYTGEIEGEKNREYSKIFLNDLTDSQYDLMEKLSGKDKRRG